MMEILSIVAIILVLSVLAIPAFSNFSNGAKYSAAERNTGALNSAVEQFNQIGGLVTAQVPMNAATSDDELKVFNLLRSESSPSRTLSGQFVASHEVPIIDTKGFRAVWISVLQTDLLVI